MSGAPPRPATTLRLADGTTFAGTSFGAAGGCHGELVFTTGMTGYVETLTDPSYRGQILVMTYPLQGNYGVPAGPFESDRIQVAGLVVATVAAVPSHHRAVRSLGDWLVAAGVPAMADVDTRAITRRLRAHGTMAATLGTPAPDERGVDMARVAELVTAPGVVRYPGPGPRILVIDTGAKESIVRALTSRGAAVTRAAFYHPWEALLPEVDGVMLSNGPGDPTALAPLVGRLRTVLASDRPVFGICLGHQLLALAAGARTYKLPYGHRSHNQPAIERGTGRAFVTSQNHGYAVDAASLPDGWEPWFDNGNDRSNEGLRHRTAPWCSVQFHPEAAAGPHDTAYLFDDFLRVVGERRRAA